MANILAYTSPAIGHLYPLTALLLELQARGHTIHLRTLSSQVDFVRPWIPYGGDRPTY